jgi:hypothetical protein
MIDCDQKSGSVFEAVPIRPVRLSSEWELSPETNAGCIEIDIDTAT